ncbi:2-oxoglutarate and iron-dependent oxygenase domain-containing protein [Planktotalea sp.]|uniref:isopenicillin N synthase family dioxygenase n=1 Tax=Planktotalea sp. TaxID=2029877 RepID=UPI0032992822
MIPRIDAAALINPQHPDHQTAKDAARIGATDVGFLTVYNTPISPDSVSHVIELYRAFFHLPSAQKETYDMSKTGSNRGWGGAQSEQVDPDANPDYKQVFDCGVELDPDDPINKLKLPAYAPNIWPEVPEGFSKALQHYYRETTDFALDLLCVVADAADANGDYFRDKFSRPMALLRGNYYPERPAWATAKDFGIATHTDYGCLTLLATDGSPGLEVRKRGGGWTPVQAPIGEFVINFGEMLEFWTGGKIKATPHRVLGPKHERISVPLFFNPNHDTVVSPDADAPVLANDHLQRRFDETYVHLQAKTA